MKSVNLYLASGVSDTFGFWLVNFTEEDDIINSSKSKLLEFYRKELFGLEGAIDVMQAINNTLDILVLDSEFDRYELDNSSIAYSSDIPINIIEDIFDLWAYNYNNKVLWKKYLGLLALRKKFRNNNHYINLGLKGKSYEFSVKLDNLLNYKSSNSSKISNKYNELMW